MTFCLFLLRFFGKEEEKELCLVYFDLVAGDGGHVNDRRRLVTKDWKIENQACR